ncbi:hypothetical protein HY500_01815 [Candidatus Woesearchaeota archaeon]|nr:hypothetical protein [Candidatus Woesearchaeota archaeon]
MQKFIVTISEIIQETTDVKTFRLKFNNGEFVGFLPGQFVMVALENDPKNAKAYSLASSSCIKDYIEITVKIYPDGKFSPLLDKAKVGDKLTISGPFGHFNYKEELANELVLIFGGTGIVPFRSMINTIFDNNGDIKVTLIGCYKKPEDIIYKKELERWSKKIKIITTITRPGTSKIKWNGPTGRIDKKIIEPYFNGNNSLFYLCGPNKMVDGLREVLNSIGVNKENIKFERWG